jgi:trehalose 6-phosphate phosphatase
MNSSETLDALARLAAEPERAGLFLDVDGVLAPIVQRPEDAQVPAATRTELRRLVEKYALVACVSGRAGEDAERIVGVAGITYVGNHGLELAPGAEGWASRLQQFLAEVDWTRLENKGLTAALHYRDLDDHDAARAALEKIAVRAQEQGFAARFGRMVLEILPPIRADKGTAIRALLDRYGLARALAAGDDTTDLDSFAAVEGLELGVRVAVASDEGPQELRAAADLVVEGPEEFLGVLHQL